MVCYVDWFHGCSNLIRIACIDVSAQALKDAHFGEWIVQQLDVLEDYGVGMLEELVRNGESFFVYITVLFTSVDVLERTHDVFTERTVDSLVDYVTRTMKTDDEKVGKRVHRLSITIAILASVGRWNFIGGISFLNMRYQTNCCRYFFASISLKLC